MKARCSYLCVEDDALSREMLYTLFTEIVGVTHLTIFADSQNFLERVKAVMPRPDFILLDIHVYPHDGYQMLRMLRGDPQLKDIRVLAVTAGLLSDEVTRIKAAGFDGAIAKPLDLLTFAGLIERLENGEAVWQLR